MIQVTPQMRILLALEPADFRRGIDGLSKVCREELKSDPFSGTVFVFRNRSAKAIKILVYDSQGFWLATKRLSAGRFRWWPQTQSASGAKKSLAAHELQMLLWNGDPDRAGAQAEWRRVTPPEG